MSAAVGVGAIVINHSDRSAHSTRRLLLYGSTCRDNPSQLGAFGSPRAALVRHARPTGVSRAIRALAALVELAKALKLVGDAAAQVEIVLAAPPR